MFRQTGFAIILSAVSICPLAAPSFAEAPQYALSHDLKLDQVAASRPEPSAPPPVPPHMPSARPPHTILLGLDIAGRLATAEIYLGVKSNQIDAWRAYTSALIDFMIPTHHVDNNQPGTYDHNGLPLEAEAVEAISRAGKAEALQGAVEKLKQVLDPAQIAKLTELETALLPNHDEVELTPPPPYDDRQSCEAMRSDLERTPFRPLEK